MRERQTAVFPVKVRIKLQLSRVIVAWVLTMSDIASNCGFAFPAKIDVLKVRRLPFLHLRGQQRVSSVCGVPIYLFHTSYLSHFMQSGKFYQICSDPILDSE